MRPPPGRNPITPESAIHTTSRLEALARVLDLLAGLLDVGADLVGHALGLEPLVADGLADGLLGLALDLLGLVLGLAGVTHWRSFPRGLAYRPPLPRGNRSNPFG